MATSIHNPAGQAPAPQDPLADQQALLEQVGPAIKDLLTTRIDPDVESEKPLQFFRIRRADLYVKGVQFIYPDFTPTGEVDLFAAVAGGPSATQETASTQYDYNLDIVRTYLRKFTAALGSRPFWDIQAVADDPTSETDKAAARQWNLIADMIDSHWKPQIVNYKLASHFYKSGPVFGHIRFVQDADRFGTIQIPVMGTVPTELAPASYHCFNCGKDSSEQEVLNVAGGKECPQCHYPLGPESYKPPEMADLPQQTGVQDYPGGRVEVKLLTGKNVTTPFYGESREDLPWLLIDSNDPLAELIDLYPELADDPDFSENGGEFGTGTVASVGTMVRSSSESQSGTVHAMRNRPLHRRLYIRPCMYNLIRNKSVRQILNSKFPRGCKVSRVGEKLVRIADESIDDHIAIGSPEVTEHVQADGLCWGVLSHQDLINNIWAYIVAILERGIPTYIVDKELLDTERLNNRRFEPAEFIGTVVPDGRSIGELIYANQPLRFPDQIPSVLQLVESNYQQNIGMLPNVYGDNQGAQETADEARNNLNQALAQLGVTGSMMTQWWIDAKTCACKLWIKNPIPGMKSGGEAVDWEAAGAGNVHFESSVTMPKSWTEQRDTLNQIINQQPQLAQLLKVTDPANYEALTDMLDLPEMVNPDNDQRAALMLAIEQLSQQAPMQGPNGPEPSIPFDNFLFDPNFAIAVIRQHLNGDAMRPKAGQPGFENIKAYGMAARQSMEPPEQPGPPPMGPAGPPAPKPKTPPPPAAPAGASIAPPA